MFVYYFLFYYAFYLLLSILFVGFIAMSYFCPRLKGASINMFYSFSCLYKDSNDLFVTFVQFVFKNNKYKLL